MLQESYVTYEDNLRLAGEIISVLGALVILLLEVNEHASYFHILYTECISLPHPPLFLPLTDP